MRARGGILEIGGLIGIASRWAELIVSGTIVSGLALYGWDRRQLRAQIEQEREDRHNAIVVTKEAVMQRIDAIERRHADMQQSLETIMRSLEETGQRTAHIESAVEYIRSHLERLDDRAYQEWRIQR